MPPVAAIFIVAWVLYVWFCLRGPSCFFCGRKIGDKPVCGCPGVKR